MLTAPRQLEHDVRLALQRDPRVTRPDLIAVSADEIGTVVLRGAVDSARQRRAASDASRQVDGVFTVINHLHIRPLVGPWRADEEIRAAALRRLTEDPRIRTADIQVAVSHGEVTLRGHVPEPGQRADASEDVESLAGVLRVSNQLEIR